MSLDPLTICHLQKNTPKILTKIGPSLRRTNFCFIRETFSNVKIVLFRKCGFYIQLFNNEATALMQIQMAFFK